MKNSGTIKHSKENSAGAGNAVKAPAGMVGSTDLPVSFGAALTGRSFWICVGLVLMILSVYAPVWNFDFVDTDDPAYLYENSHVSAGLNWNGVAWAFTTLHEANWHPITWLSHMLDVQIFGMSPGPHHLVNVSLHIANTVLLFGLLYWMTGMRWRSAAVAALFALHPLHVESVAWLAERKDVLSTLFMLLTTLAYVIYVRRPGVFRYLAIALLFALGLMAKPMLVTLPFVLFLLDIWPLQRIRLKHFETRGSDDENSTPGLQQNIPRASAARAAMEKIPLLALSAASSIVTYIAQQRGGALHQFNEIPLGLRLENSLVSYVAYIRDLFWPVRLAVSYPFPQSVPISLALAALALLTGVSIFAIAGFKRHPYILIGWLWYLGTLVPVIGIIQVGGQARADRYTYIPLIGLFIILSWAIADLLAASPHRLIALPALAGVALLLCAAASSMQLEQWRNSYALWSHAAKVAPENYLAHLNLASVLYKDGMISEAVLQDYQAVRIRPDLETTHNNLAALLAAAGQSGAAIEEYRVALRIKPDYADARNSLGRMYANSGQLDDAIQQFMECLRYRPDNAEAHANLGFVLAKLNRMGESEHEFQEAIRLDPGNQTAQQGLQFIKAQASQNGVGSR